MKSKDLSRAKALLDAGAAFAAVKDEEEITAQGRGVAPFFDILNKDKNAVKGFSAADRAAGAAAAFLAVYASVTEYYAAVLSEAGSAVLKKYNVKYSYGKLIPQILSPKGTLCPFEALCAPLINTAAPEEAFKAIGEKLAELRGK